MRLVYRIGCVGGAKFAPGSEDSTRGFRGGHPQGVQERPALSPLRAAGIKAPGGVLGTRGAGPVWDGNGRDGNGRTTRAPRSPAGSQLTRGYFFFSSPGGA